MPPGRAPITTRVLARESGFAALGAALARGERGYFVCPLIDPSDALGVRSIQETHALLAARFKNYVFLGLHGKMTSEEKQSVMEKLKKGEACCVISTTVVEVGVDVPEATFIFVEGAERFGLAQLHQLRGRVGRGVKPGACFLIPTYAHQKHTRLKFLEHETSGFKIAEYDLRLRGAGEIFGTTQSGVPTFKIADPFDTALTEAAQQEAVKTIANHEINPALREMLSARFSSQSA